MDNKNSLSSEIVSDFTLNKQKLFEKLEFSKDHFKLEITSATLELDPEVDWPQLKTKFEIMVHVLCIPKKNNELLTASLQYSTQLYLLNDPYKKQPFFQIDKFIEMKVFGSDINIANIKNVVVEIAVIEKQPIVEAYALKFKIKR